MHNRCLLPAWAWLFFGLLAWIPVYASAIDDNFLTALIARVLLYAVAATALNIALGWGGMVSVAGASLAAVLMWRWRWFRIGAAVAGLCVVAWSVSGLVGGA
jgi:ABC-type branched-subunit amino acid transport system permease subunit